MSILPDYPDRLLVEFAVKNIKNPHHFPMVRWGLVSDLFALGSTSSHKLCREFGVDPDEELPSVKCEAE